MRTQYLDTLGGHECSCSDTYTTHVWRFHWRAITGWVCTYEFRTLHMDVSNNAVVFDW